MRREVLRAVPDAAGRSPSISVCTLRRSTNGGSTATSTACEQLLVEAERELLHQRDRLEVVQVHLPVAGDERLAAVERRDRLGRCALYVPSPRGLQQHSLQNSDAGQRLALEVLQRRAAAGRDVPERVLVEAERAHRGGGVAAADHRQARRPRRRPRRRRGCRRRTAPPRTRPSGRSRTPSAASASAAANGRHRVRADVEALLAGRDRVGRRPSRSSASVADLGGDDDVGRQHDLVAAARRAAARQLSTWSSSSSESPTSWPCALRNVKHIPPPTSSLSTFGQQRLDDGELVADLRRRRARRRTAASGRR